MTHVGAVAAFPVRDGFGACQVTEIGVCALAWYSADPPTLADLAGVGPLLLDHHANNGQPAEIRLNSAEPPPDWLWLGPAPLPAAGLSDGTTSAGWAWVPAQVRMQRRWDAELPEQVKKEYRAAGTRGLIDVDFGGGPVTLGAATNRLDLAGAGPIRVPPDGPVRWSALDQLPRCTSLVWSGADRGLIEALAAHPMVADLRWHEPPPRIDLRDTHLTSLSLSASTGIDLLQLPAGLDRLDLLPDTRVARASAAEDGRWLRLSLSVTELPDGLPAVRDLSVTGGGTISATFLAALPDLRSLLLAWQSAPGELTGAEALAGLTRLTQITVLDGYGVTAGTWPELPALTRLTAHGLRRTAVAALTERYRRTDVHLRLTGAKNDAWLAANLTNPFRDWADDDPRAGAAACKAYATAVRSLAKPGADAKVVLHGLVQQLNRIDARYQFIDTICREEAGDAFLALAGQHGVPTDQADEWFDDWRDF